MERFGYPSIDRIKDEIALDLNRGNEKLLNNNTKELLKCIDTVNRRIENLLMRDRCFKLRYDSIKRRVDIYSTSILIYDYVVLNFYSNSGSTLHATESAYKQLKKIIFDEIKGGKNG